MIIKGLSLFSQPVQLLKYTFRFFTSVTYVSVVWPSSPWFDTYAKLCVIFLSPSLFISSSKKLLSYVSFSYFFLYLCAPFYCHLSLNYLSSYVCHFSLSVCLFVYVPLLLSMCVRIIIFVSGINFCLWKLIIFKWFAFIFVCFILFRCFSWFFWIVNLMIVKLSLLLWWIKRPHEIFLEIIFKLFGVCKVHLKH